MTSLFRGIGWRVFFSFSTLLIFLTLTLSFVALKFVQKTATDNAANELRVLSVILSEQVHHYLRRIETGAKSLSGTSGVLDTELLRDVPRKKRLQNFLQMKLAQLPTFDALSVFNTSGICVASTDADWIGLPAQREQFFINGLKRFSFAELYVSRQTQEKVLLVSMPINEGVDPHGVLVGRVRLDSINDLMSQQLGLGPTSEAFLLDSKFRFITPVKGVPGELLESHLASTPLVQHLEDEFWVGQYRNYKGKAVLGTVFRLPFNHWYLVVERNFAEVQGRLSEVKRALFTATIVLLFLLILVTVLLTHSITRPLQALVESTQRIAAGDLMQPVVVPSAADEIAFLATEFDKMRARVAASRGKLIEQLEESEQRRIESERLAAIGTMASSLAHEIRNPLNAVNLLITQLERTQGDESRKKMMVEDMRSEIARLDRLVSDILDYARPLQLQKVKIEMKSFLEGVLTFYKGIFDERKITVKMNFTPSPVEIEGDRDRLHQAFVNLIQNAIDAMPRGGILTVSCELQGQVAKCVIRDTGVGIAEAAMRRLFDLFFTTKEKGTGLGLSTVRKIVDAHRGKIDVESAPQKGTAIIIQLPMTSTG